MAVRAQNAATIGVVQQAKIADDFVFVRRHALAENAQIRVAVAFAHVAKHLIVSAIFLDDIDDVLENAWLADAFWHRHSRLIFARQQFGLRQKRITQISQRDLREFLQFAF